MRIQGWVLLLGFLVLSLGGCLSQTAPSPTAAAVPFQVAPVNGIEVLKIASIPIQIRVVVHGNLPAACDILGKEGMVLDHYLIGVILPVERQAGVSCAGQPVPFEKVIALDLQSLQAGAYTIEVNGVSANFELTAQELGLSAAAATANPTQAPAVTPASSVTEAVTANLTQATTATPAPTTAVAAAASATSMPALSATASCSDMAQFIDDVTIPDYSVVPAGTEFDKRWRIKNVGSCPWKAGYQFAFLSGETMKGPRTMDLPAASPGDSILVSVHLTAPETAGGYTSNWTLLDAQGKPIPFYGVPQDYIWVKINIPEKQAACLAAAAQPVAVTGGPDPKFPDAGFKFATCISAPNADFANEVIRLINQERAGRGLAALKANPLLGAAALEHSMDMSCNNFVDHYGSDGSTWFTRVKNQGYGYRYTSENIASGNPAFGGNASWVVESNWMNSQVHRDNILNPNITEIGVAYVFNPNTAWGGYTTVDFALR